MIDSTISNYSNIKVLIYINDIIIVNKFQFLLNFDDDDDNIDDDDDDDCIDFTFILKY